MNPDMIIEPSHKHVLLRRPTHIPNDCEPARDSTEFYSGGAKGEELCMTVVQRSCFAATGTSSLNNADNMGIDTGAHVERNDGQESCVKANCMILAPKHDGNVFDILIERILSYLMSKCGTTSVLHDWSGSVGRRR